MILSFHPIYEADKNIICAGREPSEEDLKYIRQAKAVILPQGCKEPLYKMAAKNCPSIFPDYTARFQYPGKTGQAKMFRLTGSAFPKTEAFRNLKAFYAQYPNLKDFNSINFPFILKYDWGGEGETVFLINNTEELGLYLEKIKTLEKSNHLGFLIQEYIDHDNRSLRVNVIGTVFSSYFRVNKEGADFKSSIASGGEIDFDSDSDLQKKAIKEVKKICAKTGINLAGFDIIIPKNSETPMFLEVNYFFGRRGLGGSEKYYQLLTSEIDKWVAGLSDN